MQMVARKIGVSENCVHRRANVVRHVEQKRGFGIVGSLCFFGGLGQLLLLVELVRPLAADDNTR